MRDAGERDRGAQAPAAPLRRRRSSTPPAEEGSNGAVRLALELAERDPRYFMPFQYANDANPRAHYEGTGAEIAEALDRVDVLVAGLGTGGTLMGTGERLRESFPDIVVAAAEPLPGDPVMGLRSLDDGYVPPILDVSKLDRKVLVSNAESVAGLRALLDREGDLRRRLRGAVVHVARKLAEELDEGVVVCDPRRRAAGSTSPPTSGTPTTSRSRWRRPSGGSPRGRPSALVEHALAEDPNEACGLVVLPRRRRGALRPRPQRRRVAVPLRARGRRPSCGSSRTTATSSRSSTRTSRRRRARPAPMSRTSASGKASRTSSIVGARTISQPGRSATARSSAN